MAHMLLPILSSFAPALLNSIMGGDPNKQYRNRVNNLIAPQNMGRLTNQFFQQGLGSPAMALAQRQVAQGSNAAGNAVQARAAQSGVGNSGLGAIGASVGPSIAGNGLAGLQAQLWQQAQGQAQNSIQQQIAALQGQMPASQTQQLFAGGLSALGPLLQAYLQHLSSGGLGGGGGGSVMNFNPMQPRPGQGGLGGSFIHG